MPVILPDLTINDNYLTYLERIRNKMAYYETVYNPSISYPVKHIASCLIWLTDYENLVYSQYVQGVPGRIDVKLFFFSLNNNQKNWI